MRTIFFAIGVIVAGPPAAAQNFTTQPEVQPIIEMTRANWVAIGTQTGSDLLYFTHLLAWRCGVSEIRYGLNGSAPDTVLQMEPCHRETNQPNAINDLPYIVHDLGSISALTVEVVFPDGQTVQQDYDRASVQID